MKNFVFILLALLLTNLYSRESFKSRLTCQLHHNAPDYTRKLLYPLYEHEPEPYSQTNNPVTMYPHYMEELYEGDFLFSLDNNECKLYFGTARLIHPRKRNRQAIANKYSFINFDSGLNRIYTKCLVKKTTIDHQSYYSIKLTEKKQVKFILDEMINIGNTKLGPDLKKADGSNLTVKRLLSYAKYIPRNPNIVQTVDIIDGREIHNYVPIRMPEFLFSHQDANKLTLQYDIPNSELVLLKERNRIKDSIHLVCTTGKLEKGNIQRAN
ncbi:hypothetical protein N9N67_04680 [Bacteriovoracaceae bacterium]|nr:hypothetical protein [Bacteriovoracaceae bacterium]